jgi:hypothetical protein
MAPALFPEDTLRYSLAVFRGDALQMVVAEPEWALHAAVAFRALVLAASEKPRIELRMAIGIGSIDFIPKNDVHEGDGEAFRLSGRALDEMKGTETLDIRCPGPDGSILSQVVVKLIDAVMDGWTASQARAVAGALRGKTQEEIAESWPGGPILRQTAGRHLRRPHWDAVREGLESIRGVLR